MTPEKLYAKYPHIILGSIQRVPVGEKILCGKNDIIISKGTICIIRCATAGAIPVCRGTRMINTCEAYDVKQCRACQKYLINNRRRKRRLEKRDSK